MTETNGTDMTKQEAIAEIENELAEVQTRSQGFADWKGELNLCTMAENIYTIVHKVSE